MVCQEDPTRKDPEVLLGVRWYVIITLVERTTVEAEVTKDAVGHSHLLLFCSLRCEFGRGLGGMTRKQIPAQFQEELSNNLSCLTTCLLWKGWSSRSLMCSSQGMPDPYPGRGLK